LIHLEVQSTIIFSNSNLHFEDVWVYNAINAEQALDLFMEYAPAVVIANLDTLRQAGIPFIEEIRNITPTVPIIFTNGKEIIATPVELFEMGLDNDQTNNDINANNIFKAIKNSVRNQRQQHHIELSASIFFYSALAMTITNRDRQIVSVNSAFCRITGYSQKEVLGCNPNILSSGKHDARFYQAMWQSINTTHHWSGEIWNKRKNGDLFLEWITINAITNSQGDVSHYFSVFADITERKIAEEAIRKLTYHDTLTELPNRRLFMDRLKQEMHKAEQANELIAVLFVDIDNLKDINDTLGHDCGDLVIRETAKRLQHSVRDTDTVARFGGDEFTICLTGLVAADDVNAITETILNAMAQPFQLPDEQLYLSASIGIAVYPDDAASIPDLLKQADQAMFSAKYSGRNRAHYFKPSMQEYAIARKTMINDLRIAVAASQFTLCYQPIVTLASQEIYKAEALIRWQHPQNGTVSPIHFIPVAEESGIISVIGDWVFRQAALQAKVWQQKYHNNFQISINTSPKQFQNDSNMHIDWLAFLKEIDLPSNSVIVEITEGVLMDSDNINTNQLLKFRDAGIQVALDDFGTGYSSLAYLKKFDIDYIKIDQTFVRNLENSSDDQVLCEAIIIMAHKLGLKVIAEGIENEQQQQILKEAGCDYGQGYLFSKPVSVANFEKMMVQT
ncbi:MAG: EAL domain-containing protein, partial [Gammaproteobacteria bacterium]|nr:EAL domain-containing protein [Gammaproteobacteria bacterium]